MEQFIKHKIHNHTFILSGNRCIFWEEKKSLILSDLHLGKTGHFRKNGIAVPQNIYKDDMHRLVDAIQFFKPGNLIIVGDMFHSRENNEMGLFLKWRNDLSSRSSKSHFYFGDKNQLSIKVKEAKQF
ncbi:MAG: hypothetical protein IPJ81_10085 [Chitinophagaceae bacterium]|nr:hypothetical protein [Chitinophagaceae bacterium]